jgi:DNA-binding transcriptional ArsR family regulator
VFDRVVVDRQVFDALASDTRVAILKELDERRKTLTELSQKLECNKAAVYKHLSKLVGVGLIKKEEKVHKWIYYSLTWSGKNLLHPERVKITLLLSTAVILLVGTIISAYYYIKEEIADSGAGIAQTQQQSNTFLVFIGFFSISLIFFVLTFFIWRASKKDVKI